MSKTMIPDRGDNPKRRVKYSDMNVTKLNNGAYQISHMDSGQRHERTYYYSSKRDAMKSHKDKYEGK